MGAQLRLFELTYMVAKELGVVFEGVVNATGTTTTTIDTTDLKDNYEDDFFAHSMLWVLYSYVTPWETPAILTAPEGEWARVTYFKKSTGTLTHTALTQAIPVLGRYAIMTPEYSKDTIISAINQTLQDVPIEYHNETLSTASGQREYTLPYVIFDQRIEVYVNLNDVSGDGEWHKLHDWTIEEDPTGSAKKLVFKTQPPSPYHMRIRYWQPHPPLNTIYNPLRESVNPLLVIYGSALNCLKWKKSQKSVTEPILDQRIQDMAMKYESAKWAYPVREDYIKYNKLGF